MSPLALVSRLAFLTLCGATLALGACASKGNEATAAESPVCAKSAVAGSVTYRERIALDPGALIDVRLVDAAKADAPAVTIAEMSIVAEGKQVPIQFTLIYDGAAVKPHARLLLQARITVDGKLRWITATSVPFDPAKTTQPVELLVTAVR